MRILLVLVALLVPYALTPPGVADANKSIGVLVSGDHLTKPTRKQAEKWLRSNRQRVVTNPMPSDAVNTLLNCFVLDDPKCMRSVVDARSRTDSLVSIRVEVASKKQREVRLTIDWFVKGHNPVSSRRTCDECTEAVLRKTIDTMLADLAKTAPGFMGRIKITSDPPGITVLLDNETAGVTPVERAVPVGTHEVRLVRDGRAGDAKSIVVESGVTTELELDPPAAAPPVAERPLPPARRSRLVPGLFIGIGLAALAAGAGLYYMDEDVTGKARTYRDTAPLGVGVAAGGGTLMLTGVIVILATGSTSAPTMAVTPGGATIGWATRF